MQVHLLHVVHVVSVVYAAVCKTIFWSCTQVGKGLPNDWMKKPVPKSKAPVYSFKVTLTHSWQSRSSGWLWNHYPE